MNDRRFRGQWSSAAPLWGVMAVWLVALTFAEQAEALPVFARKYHTSCITCHTIYPKLNNVGESFRRNGYQFPSDEDVLVKEEPVKLGIDAYKEMFPNSIWPSTLPSIPPVSVFAIMQNIIHLNPQGQEKTWDLACPQDIEIIGAGTMGKDISAFYDLGFSTSFANATVAANGVPVPSATSEAIGFGRVFVQFSNLFAWDPDEDDNGVHEGNRFAVLPPHALNLKVGKIDPAVLPHVISEESLIDVLGPFPTNQFILGQTGFIMFSEQPGMELNGIIKQYWSYAVGIANGGSADTSLVDDNTFKDVYFRVTHKWFGAPLDGVVGQAAETGKGAAQTAQSNPDESEPAGLDFWRQVGFETIAFGWWGKANVADPLPVVYNPNDLSTYTPDYFRRVGCDARLQYFDLDLYGCAFWGYDSFAGFDQTGAPAPNTNMFGALVEADYMFKPWLMGFLRYEKVKIYDPGFSNPDGLAWGLGAAGPMERIVPGVVFVVRQNVKVTSDVFIDLAGHHIPDGAIPESTMQWVTTLEFAF